MFDFDGGVHRINGAHQVDTVQVHSWEEVYQALEEVKASNYQTIIIDTVGKMLAFMEAYIKKTMPKNKKADGSLSLQGFGVRKQMFITFNNEVRAMGRNVIYVAHEQEQKRGEDTIIRPEVGGSSINDLIKELDLVGYMEAYGSQRTITFEPQQKFYAKNTCGLTGVINVPQLLDANGAPIAQNTFFCQVIEAYHQRLNENKEKTSRFEQLCKEIEANIAAVKDAESANNFVSWMQTVDHVYYSRALALDEFKAKVAELKLHFNKETKTYSDVA
jgi:hypothetical protein